MKNYDVYFDIYGKKLKTTVTAENKYEAMEIVRKKVVFIKVVERDDDMLNRLKDIFGM